MRSLDEIDRVFALAEEGHTQTDIAAAVGIGQTTVSRWLRKGHVATRAPPRRAGRVKSTTCPDNCPYRATAPPEAYAYLLGRYLGDGCIADGVKATYRLFLACCAAYPDIIEESRHAIAAVVPDSSVGQRSRSGCTELTCRSLHWPCLLPQHGPGRKHTRPIALEPWQTEIALGRFPDRFIRGLIHSDGCRAINRVRGANGNSYAYPRYFSSNRSADIRGLFVEACERLDVEWRQMNRFNISVARRASVELLDAIVGPKS
jgi:hypothetical protein